MAEKKPDATKDPDFQRVIQTFLNTPPKPHKPQAELKVGGKPAGATGKRKSQKGTRVKG
jgi:hypothetical protein